MIILANTLLGVAATLITSGVIATVALLWRLDKGLIRLNGSVAAQAQALQDHVTGDREDFGQLRDGQARLHERIDSLVAAHR